MRRFAIVTTACLLLSLPAQGATILSFESPVETNLETVNSQEELVTAVLSQIGFISSTAVDYSQDNGFPLTIFVAVSPTPPVMVPEPSTISLAVLGLTLLGLTGRRRERLQERS